MEAEVTIHRLTTRMTFLHANLGRTAQHQEVALVAHHAAADHRTVKAGDQAHGQQGWPEQGWDMLWEETKIMAVSSEIQPRETVASSTTGEQDQAIPDHLHRAFQAAGTSLRGLAEPRDGEIAKSTCL